jgi:homoserine kinase
MAVTGLGDTVIAHRAATPGVTIKRISGDGGKLPLDPAQNTAAIAADFVRRQVQPNAGVELEIEKGLPLASGLGSSAASAVAAAVATNALLGSPLLPMDLLPACLEAEAAVSGRHADNVAPALLGGIVLVTGVERGDLYPLPVPANLYFALVTPDVAVATADARAVLPKTVPLPTVVQQTKALAQLIHALHTGDLPLLAKAMAGDAIVELARAHLMPHFARARQTAVEHGALACIISGAGPTLCILAPGQREAGNIGEVVCAMYVAQGIGATCHIAQPSLRGAYSFGV